MSTVVDSKKPKRFTESAEAKPDTSGWTELQHIQYLIGIWDGIEDHPVIHQKLPEWTWIPNDRWRQLRGILSDHPEHDTSAARHADRESEFEHDRRKFGR